MVKKKIAVIGGGAAGLMAAGEAAVTGGADVEVTLFEKNEKLGKKLIITGKGRCNVTNLCDINEFMRNVATNGKFLYSALNYFSPRDCMDFFGGLGVRLKVERGNRVFPESDKSFDIIDALKKFINTNGVKIKFAKVQKILAENGKITGLIADRQYDFDSIIICTGGTSYKSTGSDGDGYKFARDLGHTVATLKPSLVPIEIREPFCAELMGLTLRNVKLTVFDDSDNEKSEKIKKKISDDFGEMLFTHFGVSGPLVLSASSHIRHIGERNYTLNIDLKPALSTEQLDKRILSDFEKYKNKDFKNCLDDLLPKTLIPVFVKLSGIDPDKKVNEITRTERLNIVSLLKNFELTVKKFRPIDEAIITCGGIDVREIHSNRMESKLVSGLYFAGEIIDVDAYTGGFNLQIAFATGKLAGKSAGKEL